MYSVKVFAEISACVVHVANSLSKNPELLLLHVLLLLLLTESRVFFFLCFVVTSNSKMRKMLYYMSASVPYRIIFYVLFVLLSVSENMIYTFVI